MIDIEFGRHNSLLRVKGIEILIIQLKIILLLYTGKEKHWFQYIGLFRMYITSYLSLVC